MVVDETIIIRSVERLSHAEASRLAGLAENCGARSVVLDLSRCLEATTAAFARLVLLRRSLLQNGRDLRLAGLRGQPSKLMEVHRLEGVLPRISQVPREAPKASGRGAGCREGEYQMGDAGHAVAMCA